MTNTNKTNILWLISKGCNVADIAQHYKFSRPTIYRLLQSEGITYRPGCGRGCSLDGDLMSKIRGKGILIPKPCEKCGANKTHGHHDDHKKILQVRWLCPSCHAGLHGASNKHSLFKRFIIQTFGSVKEGCIELAKECKSKKYKVTADTLRMIVEGYQKPSLRLCNAIFGATMGAIGVKELRPDIYEQIMESNVLEDLRELKPEMFNV